MTSQNVWTKTREQQWSQRSDQVAYSELIQKFWGGFIAIALSIVRDLAVAEEVVQQAVAEELRRHKYRHNGGRSFKSFMSWLVGKRAADAARREGRYLHVLTEDEDDENRGLLVPVARDAPPESPVVEDELREHLRQAVASVIWYLATDPSVPKGQRLDAADLAIILLHYWGDVKFADIAELLGATEDFVNKRHERLKKKLRDEFEKRGYHG